MTTPIKSYEEIRGELRVLLVKLDDAIYYRERVVTPEDRVEAIERVDKAKTNIVDYFIEQMKEREAGLVEKFADFVDKYNVDLMTPDELRKELTSLLTSSKE